MENPFCFAYTVTDFINAREAGLACGFFCLQDYRPGSVITAVILPNLN